MTRVVLWTGADDSAPGERARADLAGLIIDNARRFVAGTPLRHVARSDYARAHGR
jgi:hypothetical protein